MDFTPQLPRNIDSAHSFFACLLLQKYGNDKKIINKKYKRLVIGDRTNRVCKEVIMSLLNKFGSKTKKAAVASLLALPLTFGAMSAGAEVQDNRAHSASTAAVQGLASKYAERGNGVAILHTGELSPNADYYLDGTLRALEEDYPHINLAVLSGGEEAGKVHLYVNGVGYEYSEDVIATGNLGTVIKRHIDGQQLASANQQQVGRSTIYPNSAGLALTH